MRKLLTVLLLLTFAQSAVAGPLSKIKHALKAAAPVLEHIALGAGTEVAVSQAAGGSHKWPAGLVATGLVAGFKEGADAAAGRDTKKKAAIHGLTILAGAGAAIAAKH